VGTGAFQLEKWEEAKSLSMVKNRHYWKLDSRGNHLPYLDEIQISFIEDQNEEYEKFLSGDLDFLTHISLSTKDKILEKNGEIKEDFAQKFDGLKLPYINTEYVGFLLEGTEKENPLMNIKLRQAMSYAINREKLIATLRNGLGSPGNHGFVPLALPSFDSTKVKGYGYNPTKAQELLKEAGYPKGIGLPKLTLHTYTSDRNLAEFLQKEWNAIGIKVDIETTTFSTHQEKVDHGKVKLFRGSWLGDYPDAENYLAMFYSENFSPIGPNKFHFSNSEFDKLFVEAHESDNLFTRYEDYWRMDQIVMDYASVIVLYYDEVLFLKQNNIVGLEVNEMLNLKFEAVDIRK
jgi:ABC-type transport system substrate-binding protein